MIKNCTMKSFHNRNKGTHYSSSKLGTDVGKIDGTIPFPSYTNTLEVSTHTLPIIGEIESPSDFIDHCYLIDQAEEYDTIVLKINSPGGSLAGVDYLLHSLNKTPAKIVAEVTGLCCSAATLVLLSADEFEISSNAEILIHNAFFQTGGKVKDVVDYVTFIDKENKAILDRYYAGMFTEEEMKELYDGKQFYMNGDEFIERFSKRQEYLKAIEEAEGTSEDVSKESSVDDYGFEESFPELEEL